jgi:hypothetical protein
MKPNNFKIETVFTKKFFDETSKYVFEDSQNFMARKNSSIHVCGIDITLGCALITASAITNLHDKLFKQHISDMRLVFNDVKGDKVSFKKYLNSILEVCKEFTTDMFLVSTIIADIIRDFSELAVKANTLYTNTVNLYDLARISNKNPEFDSLLNLVIPDNLQFSEIEDYIKVNLSQLVSILSDEDSCFKTLINCGSAVNQKQLGQTVMMIGLKPNLEGMIIPEPINTSFLRGMRSPEDFLTNAIGARKALITNFTNVKDSGYLSRKLEILMTDHHCTSEECCNSLYGITCHIDCEETLRRVNGRYTTNGGRILKSDTSWIGQTVELRSPITCNSKETVIDFKVIKDQALETTPTASTIPMTNTILQSLKVRQFVDSNVNMDELYDIKGLALISIFKYDDYSLSYAIFESDEYATECDSPLLSVTKDFLDETAFNENIKHVLIQKSSVENRGVCHTCYGDLYHLNKHFHTGIVAVLLLTNILTQLLLSSKHLLQTKSEYISWGDSFNDYFYQDKANILASTTIKEILINRDDIQEDTDGDYFINKFVISPTSGDAFEYNSPIELYFASAEISNAMKNSNDTDDITQNNIFTDTKVFYIKMSNIELSSSLKKILSLLESSDHNGYGNDINGIYESFIQLLNESNIETSSVHIEMILRGLLRDANQPMFFPETGDPLVEPQISVLSVPNAILHSNNLAASLSFQGIKMQLRTVSTYRKDGVSPFDKLYV